MAGTPYQQKPLGPSFMLEVAEAGLDIAWMSDGTIVDFDSMPPDKQEKVKALVAKHNAQALAKPTTFFTDEVEKTIIERGGTPPVQS